ncbi:uncharacterized protein LOC144882464 [Branchiostoma floridae x Branchiostoma japonicum]
MWKFLLFIVAVITCPRIAQGENVALNKPAYQTSNAPNGDANNAVDGVIGSCSSTLEEDYPSWWVDLGQRHKIDRVDIFKGQDGGGNLDPFDIHIGDSPHVIDNSKCGGLHHIDANQPLVSVSCRGREGRYVGIRLPGPRRTLRTCEVQVDGEIDECSPSPCVHGICYDAIGSYICACQDGWVGTNCDTNFDECTGSPCLHGTCTDTMGAYTCRCEGGWTGHNCDQNINECLNNPCVHGVCTDTIGSYNCSCETGWEGTNCDQDIDDCRPSPCLHGTCADDLASYTCTCTTGWEGINCDQDRDWCSDPQACAPGQVCEDYELYYLCIEQHGARGLPYKCSSDSCLEGMYCISEGVARYSCRPE